MSWTISVCFTPKALQSTAHLWLPPQSGQRAALPKGHSRHLQSAFYSFRIKIVLFYCVLKISAPDFSLSLCWQKDASIAVPQKPLLGFERWMEAGVGLLWCGKHNSWTFLLNSSWRKNCQRSFYPAWYLQEQHPPQWGPAHTPGAPGLPQPVQELPLSRGGLEAPPVKFCSYWCTARRRWCEFCSQGCTWKGCWVVLLLGEVKRAASVHFTTKPHWVGLATALIGLLAHSW